MVKRIPEPSFGFVMWAMMAAIVLLVIVVSFRMAWSRDDGRYADSPIKPWFDQLASKKGNQCCSFADGFKVENVDYDTDCYAPAMGAPLLCQFRVRLCVDLKKSYVDSNPELKTCRKDWVVVPDEALVIEPNKFGPPVVWPFATGQGGTMIRCFMPGSGT